MPMMESTTNKDSRSRIVVLESDAEPSLSALLEPLDLDVIRLATASALTSDLEIHRPDIVFMDLDGLNVDGKALCASLREDPAWWYVPIVLVGSGITTEGRSELLEHGADEVLERPVAVREVHARVWSLLRMRKMHDQVLSYQLSQHALFHLTTLSDHGPFSPEVLQELAERTRELTGMDQVYITSGGARTWEILANHVGEGASPGDVLPTLGERVWEVLEGREIVRHDAGPGPYIGVPLMTSDEEIRGILHGFGGEALPAQDRVELLGIVGQRICNELQMREYNQRLRAEVDERTMELKTAIRDVAEANRKLVQASEDTMNRLAMAATYRDVDTGSHIDRMSDYSAAISAELGWTLDQQELLRLAAPMHDVGKIGIPDAILLKPGQLTPEEWENMREHPAIGAKILGGSTSKLLQMAEVIALTHHERFDGGGYPEGLRGEAVPLVGRIVALADVFDALTTDRRYKEAWTLEEALERVREDSGKHFDPKVVDAFFRALPEIQSIYWRRRRDRKQRKTETA
jgi:response regulator RpfG family c-di-GMP phosphodiesterase